MGRIRKVSETETDYTLSDGTVVRVTENAGMPVEFLACSPGEDSFRDPTSAELHEAAKLREGEKSIEDENSEVIEAFLQRLNYMGNDTRMVSQIYDHLFREHRTIQQNFFRVMKAVIERYGEFQGPAYADGRNQNAKEWALKVREAGRDVYLPYV